MYSLALFWHAFFTMTIGYLSAGYIFFKMSSLAGTDAAMINGFKMMLFGVLIGTIDYMGANATKGNMEAVLKSMGFLEHTSVITDDQAEITLTASDGSTSTTTTIGTDEVDATLDYEKLMYMQDKWFNFFAIQRGVQLIAPYLFMLAIELAISGILFLAFIYM